MTDKNTAATEGFGLREIGQIAITVKDIDAATAFYRDKLGMRHLFSVPGMAFFDLGGVRLMLGPASSPELEHPASLIYYRVEDIEAATAILKDRGIEFEHEPRLVHPGETSDLWLAFLRDMEGNFVGLMEDKAKPAV